MPGGPNPNPNDSQVGADVRRGLVCHGAACTHARATARAERPGRGGGRAAHRKPGRHAAASPLILHPLLSQPPLLHPLNPTRWAPTRAQRDATSCSHRHGARRWCTSRRAARTPVPWRGPSSSCPHRRPRRRRPPRASRSWRAGARRARARAWRRRCSASGGAGCATCTAIQCATHHTSNAPRRDLPTRSPHEISPRTLGEISPRGIRTRPPCRQCRTLPRAGAPLPHPDAPGRDLRAARRPLRLARAAAPPRLRHVLSRQHLRAHRQGQRAPLGTGTRHSTRHGSRHTA